MELRQIMDGYILKLDDFLAYFLTINIQRKFKPL